MKKGVTIELDKPRTLRYGMNALAAIEDLSGKTLMSLDLNSVGIKDLLIIVYAGLCHEDKSLSRWNRSVTCSTSIRIFRTSRKKSVRL